MTFHTWAASRDAASFDCIIDARSPAEYAEDHLPGAVNLPVLDDAERIEIGTLYCQESRFLARRRGGAMVARNVAQHLDTFFATLPENARVLVYCWRGGQRSRAMGTILHAVGWNVSVLAGGYKAWRRTIRDAMTTQVPALEYRVLAGLTGAGKSHVLRAMAAMGAQVLDLENIGAHRGSLLGVEPDRPQPSQKRFETLIAAEIEKFNPACPVWVESESKRLGQLWVPETLWSAMVQAPVAELETPLPVRAAFLCQEYTHFQQDPASLIALLETLHEAHGRRQLDLWRDMILAGAWQEFAESILALHYDPAYRRNRRYAAALRLIPVTEHHPAAFQAAAASLMQSAIPAPA